jgi:hypothetical protein
VRLKQVGARIKHVPLAVGYHWHPAFSMDQIPKLINQVLLLSLEFLNIEPVSPFSVGCHWELHSAITFTDIFFPFYQASYIMFLNVHTTLNVVLSVTKPICLAQYQL